MKVSPLALAASLGVGSGCRTEPQSGLAERGRFLVEVVAGCPACHTPVDSAFRPISSLRFAGGF